MIVSGIVHLFILLKLFGGSNFKAEVLNLLFAILREVKKK